MITDKEREEVAQELVEFSQKFIGLLNDQLLEIKKEMAHICDEVMDSIQNISVAQGAKTKMAESILQEVKESENKDQKDNFEEVSAKEKSEKEREELQNAHVDMAKILTENIQKAGVGMKDKMKSLDNLDSNMQSLILTMVGAMSADDVVGQRLEHVSVALTKMNDGLQGLLATAPITGIGFETVKSFETDLNKKIYSSYTMDEERDCFQRVYGKRP